MKEALQIIALVGGIVMVGRGCYMAWPPLGLIVPGALMIVGIVASRMTWGVKEQK